MSKTLSLPSISIKAKQDGWLYIVITVTLFFFFLTNKIIYIYIKTRTNTIKQNKKYTKTTTTTKKPLNYVGLLRPNTPLRSWRPVSGGSPLNLIPVAVSPLDLHLDAFTIAVGELKNTVSRIDSRTETQI